MFVSLKTSRIFEKTKSVSPEQIRIERKERGIDLFSGSDVWRGLSVNVQSNKEIIFAFVESIIGTGHI